MNLKTVIAEINTLSCPIYSGKESLATDCRYKQEYDYGIYPNDKTMQDFLPVLRGIITSVCKDNFNFVTAISADVYHYYCYKNIDKQIADSIFTQYINSVKFLIKDSFDVIFYQSVLLYCSKAYNSQVIKDFLINYVNHLVIIQEIKDSSSWAARWRIGVTQEYITEIIKPETALTILYSKCSDSIKLLIGNHPALLNNVKAQLIWIKYFLKLSSFRPYITDLFITNAAIDAMDVKTAFRIAGIISQKFPKRIYFDTDRLIKKASIHAFASGLSIQNIKNQIKTWQQASSSNP